MTRFAPDSPVLTRVKMTRPLYAQLQGQRFFPPKPFERAQWFAEGSNEGTPEWKFRDLGVKISCGFEMLWKEAEKGLKTTDLTVTKSGECVLVSFA
jgi:SGT1 protein